MHAHLRIGRQGFVVECFVIVCGECGDVITTLFNNQRTYDARITKACQKAGYVHKSTRACKRHNKRGRSRAI